jgi:hypothetical protein
MAMAQTVAGALSLLAAAAGGPPVGTAMAPFTIFGAAPQNKSGDRTAGGRRLQAPRSPCELALANAGCVLTGVAPAGCTNVEVRQFCEASSSLYSTGNVWGLPELLHIDWRRLRDLPIGVEDNSGGFIDAETLVTGFGMGCPSPATGAETGCFLANCSSVPPAQRQACYTRPGALLNVNTYHGDPHHIAWFSRMFAVNTSGGDAHAWTALPPPPLAPRQGTCGVACHGR